jgi:hypothetical protein
MTAPSFSSFAPSFSSFPDLDTDSKDDYKHETADKKRRKKHKHKKERNKSREGSPFRQKGGQDGASKDTLQDRLFYSDRRGDFLNIQFGGLHVGDVPKYHVVDSMI